MHVRTTVFKKLAEISADRKRLSRDALWSAVVSPRAPSRRSRGYFDGPSGIPPTAKKFRHGDRFSRGNDSLRGLPAHRACSNLQTPTPPLQTTVDLQNESSSCCAFSYPGVASLGVSRLLFFRALFVLVYRYPSTPQPGLPGQRRF